MKLVRFTALALALALASASAASAATISQWDFNSLPSDNSSGTGTLTPVIGAGTVTLIGGTTSTFASGNASGGSTDPDASNNDSAFNTTTYPAQGTGNQSAGIQVSVSTLGYQDIVLTWDQRHSNTVSRYFRLQYTTDGSTYVDSVLFDGNAGGDTWYNGRSVDLTGTPGVDNNPNFAFRIVSEFAPSTSTYVATTGSSSYSTSGTSRYDMVTVTGNVVPEPSSCALAVLGLCSLVPVVRRKLRSR